MPINWIQRRIDFCLDKLFKNEFVIMDSLPRHEAYVSMWVLGLIMGVLAGLVMGTLAWLLL